MVFLPQTPSPQSNHEKDTGQTQVEGASVNACPVLFKIFKNKESWRNYHRPKEVRKMTKYNLVSWIRSWNRQRTLGKKLAKSE